MPEKDFESKTSKPIVKAPPITSRTLIIEQLYSMNTEDLVKLLHSPELAKTEPGIDLKHMGGKKLSELHPGGFDVSIAGQKLHVVTIEP